VLLALATTVFLVACNASPQAIAPINGGRPGSALPEANNGGLIYVGNACSGVCIYTYPKGKFVGTLTGFDLPTGLCSDGYGDVWVVVAGTSKVVEFVTDGAVITLSDDHEFGEGCSVDPTTGNLAVANGPNGSGYGNVAIFTQARGTPKFYTDPAIQWYFDCSYDDAGNLFVVGSGSRSSTLLAELPKGSSTMTNITLKKIQGYGFDRVMWDGHHITVSANTGQRQGGIYRLRISGNHGRVIGFTPLGGPVGFVSLAIHNATVVGTGSQDIVFWKYPQGGNPTKVIQVPYGYPGGITLSIDSL
jgi:hypothetical protein